MGDFLNFRSFVTPMVIKLFFWSGAAVIVLMYLTSMGLSYAPLGVWGTLMSLVIMVFGLFAWRVWCELILVAFRIHDSLESIRQNPDLR
jgi:hypothetical protein